MSITVRKIKVRPDAETPRYWFDGGAFETHFFNALSTTFPEGERFFIQSVRNYRSVITDVNLLSAVDAFVGQEGQHSREHDDHVQLLLEQGYSGISRFNRWQHKAMQFFLRRLPRFSLALTTAIEHLTAIFAHQLLSRPELWLARMSDDMRLLWQWHAVEETEHKAVAFDVYRNSGDEYWLRLIAMIEATVGFLIEVFLRHTYLLARDGLLFNAGEWRRGFGFLWGRQGFLRLAARDYAKYWRRDFHPWDQDNRALIAGFDVEQGDAFTATTGMTP